MTVKIGFYPCCATDIEEPLALLQGQVDVMIFCDSNRRLTAAWQAATRRLAQQSPVPLFMVSDVWQALPLLPTLSVFFYRNDSAGEGGSGIGMLQMSGLRRILRHFPDRGGLLLTDGSNGEPRTTERLFASGQLRIPADGVTLTVAGPPVESRRGVLRRISVARVAGPMRGGSSKGRRAQADE